MEIDKKWHMLFNRARKLIFPAGRLILLKGAPKGEVYRVIDGWVLVTDRHRDGTQTPLEIRGSGQLLGETSALSGLTRNADATAVCRCTLAVVSSDRFLQHVRREDLLEDLLLRAHDQHRATNMRAGAGRLGIDIGYSRLLVDLARRAGSNRVQGIPQKVIADLLGVTERTLRPHVTRLVERGVIVVRRQFTEINDEAALRRTARLD